MKKACFSFVSIQILAIVLFIAVSYLYAFRDLGHIAQKDLEVRRVAERMDDMRLALNRTLIDAMIDSGYYSYGCISGSNAVGSGFCTNFTNYATWYAANLSAAAIDEVYVNVTLLNSGCLDDIRSAGQRSHGNTFVNVTKNITMSYQIITSLPASNWKETLYYNFSINLSRSDLITGGSPRFVMSYDGITLNRSVRNETIYVNC